MPIARLAEERQKRNKYLQQKVHETLALAPPEHPTHTKTCQHGTYPLSAEEEKESVRQYQEKLRMNRILQVRAQEMLFASQRVEEFRDRKTKDNKKLLNHLKEVWREDRRRRIASLEEEFAHACQSIGLSHDAALLVERNRAAKEELLAKQAEESRYWDTLRYEEAVQKERERKEMREKVERAPTMRRKIVDCVSNIERSLAHRCTHAFKPRPHPKSGCCQIVYPPVSHDVKQDKMYNRLAGFPIDFKDTYLHSRYSVLRDCTNRPSSTVVNCPEREEVDAWRAADAQRESNRIEKARQAELERLYYEQKLERGSVAAAKLLNEQRIALLEQEVEEALKEEERQKDRVHAANLSSRRASSAGHEKRPIYTKHKISYPLSCPGSVIEGSPIQKDTTSPKKHNAAVAIETRFIPLQGHHVAFTAGPLEANKTEVGKELGRNIQNLESLIDMGHEGVKIDSELEIKNITTCHYDDGKPLKFPQQHNRLYDNGAVMALEPGVDPHHRLLHPKRGGKSPSRVACEEAEVNPIGNHEEGNALKLPFVKSPYRSPMSNKVPVKRKEIIMLRGRINPLEFEEDDGDMHAFADCRSMGARAGPTRGRREKKLDGENHTWIFDPFENGGPTQSHTCPKDSVWEDSMGVAKELSLYHRAIRTKRATHTGIHSGDVGEKSKSQPSIRPPFISSGTQGYKKILTGPLSARSPRPRSENEWPVKAAANAERASIIRGIKERFKAAASAERGSIYADIKKEETKEDIAYRSIVSPPSVKPQLSPMTHMSGRWSGGNKQGMETSRSWPYAGPLSPHEQRRALKAFFGARRQTHESVANVEQRPRQDSVLKWIGRGFVSPRRSWDMNPTSTDGICNDESGGCVSANLFYDNKRSREDVLRRGECKEHQEKRVIQEPKSVRQKAVWKSYIGEPGPPKKHSNKDKFESTPPRRARSVKSSSSPVIRNRMSSPFRPTSPSFSHQGDCQSETRLEPPHKVPHVKHYHTPPGSVKSLPNLRSKGSSCGKHKNGRRFWKDPNVSRLGIQVEALENISTRIKSLSKRFHSPVKQVPPETISLRRSRKDVSSGSDSYCLPTQSSTRKDHARRLEEINIKPASHSCEIAPGPYLDANLAEKEGIRARTDVGANSACNVAERLIDAWKTGKFQGDYTKAMRRAKALTGGLSSSETSKAYPERKYNKPWLSRSPSRKSPEQARDDVKPDPDVHDQGSNHIAPAMKNSKSPVTPRSQMRCRLSQNGKHLSNKSPMGQARVSTKTPLMKSSAGSARKTPTTDPWEGQSLDFVLGSLADQVRELDERLCSTKTSSPALSSSPSLTKGSPLRGAARTSNQPSFIANLQDKPSRTTSSKDCSSLSSSVGSSPERVYQESNHDSPTTTRNAAKAYANERKRAKDFTSTAIKKPAVGMYMDDLKSLLREISNGHPSSSRRTVPSYSIKRTNTISAGRLHVDEAQEHAEIRPECRGDAARTDVKTGFEPTYVSSTSMSVTSSRACSQTSQRAPHDPKVVRVENEETHVTRECIEDGGTDKPAGRLASKVSYDGCDVSSDKRQLNRTTERDTTPHHVTHNASHDESRVMCKDSKPVMLEMINVPHEVAHEGHHGIRGSLDMRLLERRWAPRQTAENGQEGIRERLEKRTVETRGSVPHEGIHKGHAVAKKDVETKGLASFELAEESHGLIRKSTEKTSRWPSHEVTQSDNQTPIQHNLEARSIEWASRAPQQDAPNCHVLVKENLERKTIQRGWACPHVTPSDGHVVVVESLKRKTVRRVENRASDPVLSKEGQKLRNGQPESPLWGQDRSPLSPGDWRKLGLTLDEVEERLLLSGSVDFSPWNTEKFPDIMTRQTLRGEPGNRSKTSSPVHVPDASIANWFAKKNRPKPKLTEKRRRFSTQHAHGGEQSVEFTFLQAPANAPQGSVLVNASPMRKQVLARVKRPKTGPKGADALWALSGREATPQLSSARRGTSTEKKRKPKRTSSVPKNAQRPKMESGSSREEMPDSTSKSSQDDINYLPVIMAKDDESRREVVERRRKARQLDMEHRQRLSARSSRPSSARSSV